MELTRHIHVAVKKISIKVDSSFQSFIEKFNKLEGLDKDLAKSTNRGS
jgi:hypothetical protein